MIDENGYELLDQEFTSAGFNYKQIYVNYDTGYAIYSQSKPEREKPISYEIFRITKSEEVEIYGRKYPKKYNYPGASAFGKTAFSVTTVERAHQKIKELEDKRLAPPKANTKYVPTGKPRGRPKKIIVN